MNRVPSLTFRVVLAGILFCSGVHRMNAQGPATSTPPKQDRAKQEPGKDQPANDAAKEEKGEDEGNPFAPQPVTEPAGKDVAQDPECSAQDV